MEKIISDLGLSKLPRLLVFNKSDLIDPDQARWLAESRRALAVSAVDKRSLLPLVERVSEMVGAAQVSQAPVGPGTEDSGEPLPLAGATT